MFLFRKKDIYQRILEQCSKYEIASGKPPTDIILSREELHEVYNYFKDYSVFRVESFNVQQNMINGLVIHAEYEGNTNFRMIDYK